MKIVDLNILLYAVNEDAHHHLPVRDWWEGALNGDEPVGLAWVVLLGFLRIATHARIFPSPMRSEEALDRIDNWISHPNTSIVKETDEQWRILRELLQNTGTAGNLTTDAHLASLTIAYGATLASCDADFARFQQLRWENPLLA